METKKKRLIGILFLILIAVVLYFWSQRTKNVPENIGTKNSIPEEFSGDKIPPSTAVISPENKSWHNSSFKALIYDSDLGSGLIDFLPGKQGCKYIVEDLGTGQSMGDFRECEKAEINVPVGEGETCSSSYQEKDISLGKCKVSTIAFDRAGNDSGWKSKIFNTDFIKPEVGDAQSFSAGLRETKTFSVSVSDNSKIAGCWLYIDGKAVEATPKLNPFPCQNGAECNASQEYSFEKEGERLVGFGCQDIAGNVGFGEMGTIKIVVNHDPKIIFCRVSPSRGDIETQFSFDVGVSDPDGDNLSFFWDFGDSLISQDKSPTHNYQNTGIFEPRVRVSDSRGGETNCLTAWVVAEKK